MTKPKSKSKIRRYPWDVWFKQKKFTLLQGKDFDCQIHTMTIQIRTAASSRKKKVSIHVSNDKEIIVQIQ